ncbi:MAG TPA: acyl carrier protein [Thermoleophilia bacterium]|nr:acyl carrier protein [Thermoleophilia bacterium]
MGREEIFAKVQAILVDQLEVSAEDVTMEANFQEDLDADSLDLVEVIMELEDQFDLKISDEEAEQIGTVGAAVDFIEKRV